MATTNVNTGVRRVFEHGGKITITDGTDSYVVMNIVPGGGNLTWKPGMRERKYETDQGTLMTSPLLGNEAPSECSFSVRYTSVNAATDVYGLMVAYGSNGLAKKYSVEIKLYDGNGATTGETITFANSVFEPPEIKAGAPFDEISCKFMSMVAKPTLATF